MAGCSTYWLQSFIELPGNINTIPPSKPTPPLRCYIINFIKDNYRSYLWSGLFFSRKEIIINSLFWWINGFCEQIFQRFCLAEASTGDKLKTSLLFERIGGIDAKRWWDNFFKYFIDMLPPNKSVFCHRTASQQFSESCYWCCWGL